MKSCSITRALTLLSSVFGACGLLLVGVAVSTDYWLLMEEGIVLQQNQTTEVKMALHSGLWRVCFVAGPEKGRCVASEYFTEPEIEITTENTANILKMVRTATPFPMVSLLFVFTAFVISNIGHIRPQRTILAFVSGIFFILSGLSLVVGLVLYISSINDEVMNRPREPEQFFHYHYGWSFAFAASSFLLKEGAGVMSVYLFMKRYAEEELYRPHPALYRPRMSDCSDYSGQFLHPDSWPPPQRGRSASDVSSDISIQLNQTPPPQPPPKGGTHIHYKTTHTQTQILYPESVWEEGYREGGLRRSKKSREEERKAGRRGGEAGGRRDDSPLVPSPRQRQTLKTFNTLGGNMGGEE
uniref:Voltage-dependent calcium channel gamma-7 subunit n=1 Tax=Lates calcarifer TaxID=8187 RepID=A0A4W6FNJ8_LATCA